MAATQDSYQNLIIFLQDLCKLKEQDYESLILVRAKISAEVNLIQKYELFGSGLSNDLLSVLNLSVDEFTNYRSLLAKHLYLNLVNLLAYFEITHSKQIECVEALEQAAIQLPFDSIKLWHTYDSPIDLFFKEFSIIFSSNLIDKITDENVYNSYIKQIKKKRKPIRFKPEKAISPNKFKKIESYFQQEVSNYRKFIDENFQEVRNEFVSYDSQVRVYLIPNKRSGENIISQVNQYKVPKSQSVTIYPKYLEISPRFGNIEKYDTSAISTYMGLFDESHPAKYSSGFSIRSIYFELHNLFMTKASKEQLVEYLLYFLKARGYKAKFKEESILYLEKAQEKYNCRLLFDDIPNIEKLQEILSASVASLDAIALKMVPDRETFDLLRSKKVKYFVLDFLARDQINNGNEEMLHWFIKSRINTLAAPNKIYLKGSQLITKLNSCPKGLNGWSEYETICSEIFEFLFKDNFRNFTSKYQTYTYDKIFRRDLIINNSYKDSVSFWALAKSDFNCNVIVIDFKNYVHALEQNDFYLPSKYLSVIAGNFGIVFSRAGLSPNSRELQRRLLQSKNELLLCFDDEDVIGMINEKMSGQDPTYRLENQKFNLYQTF